MRRHKFQLVTFRKGKILDLLTNSVLGLIDIYNLLPAYVVAASSVKEFQGKLQGLLKQLAGDGVDEWDSLYSPRRTLHGHRLRTLYDWNGSFPTPTPKTTGDDDGETASSANRKMRLFAF